MKILKMKSSHVEKSMTPTGKMREIWSEVNNGWEFDDGDFTVEGWFTKTIDQPKTESNEDKVIRILKGDFESVFGMTFEKFVEIRESILENNPEKLI